MDRLDRFVEDTLIPAYTRGKRRHVNPTYHRLAGLVRYYRKHGQLERSETLRRAAQQHPSGDPNDTEYRRLRYLRYADDFLLGLIGSRAEAEEIKCRLTTFLGTELHLTLADEKTLITHALTGRARFLGYEIGTLQSQTKLYNRQRSINGKVGFYIPKDVLLKKRKRYMRDGKVIHRTELINDSEYDIITRYQGEYRGLVNYYGLAQNLPSLGYVKRTMEISLLKTLAKKGKSTVAKTAKRLHAITQTTNGLRTCLKLVIPRAGKAPLVAIFGGISLRRQKLTALQDQETTAYPRMRSEIVDRLLHDTCEICGAKEEVQMHHIRRLANLNKKGRREKPLWMQIMIARKRKTIPVCRPCHMDIHHNRPKSTR
jgi:hypothetical protein